MVKLHPAYPFNPEIKQTIYGEIAKALEGKQVSLACSFPHLSNYMMERDLLKTHPETTFHCFEKKARIFEEIQKSFNKPPRIKLLRADAEECIKSRPDVYDFMFLDYMAGPGQDLNPILRSHLREGGILAETEFVGRGERPYSFQPQTGYQLQYHARYNHMMVRIFKKISGYANNDQVPIYRLGRTIIEPKRVSTGRKVPVWALEEIRKLQRASARAEARKERELDKEKRRQTWAQKCLEYQERKQVREAEKEKKRQAQEALRAARALESLRLDEERQQHREQEQKRWEETIPYLKSLPIREQKILVLYYQEKKNQPEIASLMGLTQGAVSSRISRSRERIQFLKKIPVLTKSDLDLFQSYFPEEIQQDIFRTFSQTTCQTKTAEILSQKWGKDYTQVKIRHRWKQIIQKIKAIKELKSLSSNKREQLTKLHDFMVLIDSSLYILHYMKQPQFERKEKNFHVSSWS